MSDRRRRIGSRVVGREQPLHRALDDARGGVRRGGGPRPGSRAGGHGAGRLRGRCAGGRRGGRLRHAGPRPQEGGRRPGRRDADRRHRRQGRGAGRAAAATGTAASAATAAAATAGGAGGPGALRTAALAAHLVGHRLRRRVAERVGGRHGERGRAGGGGVDRVAGRGRSVARRDRRAVARIAAGVARHDGLAVRVARPLARGEDRDRRCRRVLRPRDDRQQVARRQRHRYPGARLVVAVAGVADRDPVTECRERDGQLGRDRRQRREAANERERQHRAAVDRDGHAAGRPGGRETAGRDDRDGQLHGQAAVLGARRRGRRQEAQQRPRDRSGDERGLPGSHCSVGLAQCAAGTRAAPPHVHRTCSPRRRRPSGY